MVFGGGGIKESEDIRQAIERELVEELGFIPENLSFWREYSFTIEEKAQYKGLRITLHIFLSPITKKLEKAKVLEGNKKVKFKIADILNSDEFDLYDKQVFRLPKEHVKNEKS